MRNVYKYLPHYSAGATAEFVDGEFFRTIIKFKGTTVKTTRKTTQKIIMLIKANPKITRKDLAEKTALRPMASSTIWIN